MQRSVNCKQNKTRGNWILDLIWNEDVNEGQAKYNNSERTKTKKQNENKAPIEGKTFWANGVDAPPKEKPE